MTEDEAKTKWCPFARAGITANERTDVREPGQVGVNAARCIASACMAWRWEKFGATLGKIEAIKEHRRVHGSDLITAKNAVEAGWNPTGLHGFCGLAGAPS